MGTDQCLRSNELGGQECSSRQGSILYDDMVVMWVAYLLGLLKCAPNADRHYI